MGAKTSILLLSFLIMFFALCSALPQHKHKYYKPCKQLVLYYHENVYNGTNAGDATSAIVAAPQGANLTILASPYYFGNMVVFDNPITLNNNAHSKHVGRAQDFYLYDTNNAITYCLVWLLSFVLNTTEYQGTINFIGPNPIFEKIRDISIVGGSGDFFMHRRGIATLATDHECF